MEKIDPRLSLSPKQLVTHFCFSVPPSPSISLVRLNRSPQPPEKNFFFFSKNSCLLISWEIYSQFFLCFLPSFLHCRCLGVYYKLINFSISALKCSIQLVLDFKAQSFWMGRHSEFSKQTSYELVFSVLNLSETKCDSVTRPLQPTLFPLCPFQTQHPHLENIGLRLKI